MNKTKKFLLTCLILLFFGASCSKNMPALDGNATPVNSIPTPGWFINPSQSNIGIFVLDYQTLAFRAAYFTKQEPCGSNRQPVSEEELQERAGGLFNAVGKNWSRRVITDDKGNEQSELAFKTTLAGDLAVLDLPPGDFGGFAVLHRCSGLVIYAGSILYMGKGEQLFPANPINPDVLTHKKTSINSPQRVDVIFGPYVGHIEKESGLSAWNSIQDLNFVQDLAVSPYDVLVYLYPRTVGVFNPDDAEWVIFVQRKPTE